MVFLKSWNECAPVRTSSCSGYVQREQLKSPSDHVDSYEVCSELVVRVLYVLPAINTILLTAREINMGGRVKDVFPSVAPGLVV